MIRPPGLRAAAFALATDGDARREPQARRSIAARLGIAEEWAWAHQVHGDVALVVTAPGDQGDGDALVTSVPALPVMVATADCLPIVIEGRSSVAVVHAGWRGIAAGVIGSALATLADGGDIAVAAAIGPAIGSCCYEVGDEVASRFPGFVADTTWGTQSVDLRGAAAAQLSGISVWVSDRCTMTDHDLHSHRRDGTTRRQVTVAWVPPS